jgi:nicotinamide-nucleotide amidase
MTRAAILSIGDELTLGQSVDTNSAWLASRLAELAVLTIEHRTVADDRTAIGRAISELTVATDLLVTTGGLGPTDDDLTRESLADVFSPGQELVADANALNHLRNLFERRGRSMPKSNLRQASRPANMQCLPNPHGTAPGLAGDWTSPNNGHRCLVFSLPGPPREMQPMFADHVVPALHDREIVRDDHVLLTAFVNEFGMGESTAAQKLGDLMHRERDPLVGTTASDSIVTARIRTSGLCENASKSLDEIVSEVERLWFPYAFGRGHCTLANSVGEMLKSSRSTLAVAESCTGGLLSKFIVDVPGSSDWFKGGWVTYSNELKTHCLGVDAALIDKHGAVSAVVAMAMAQGSREAAGTDWALAITGIAGPDGGTPNKPVGTVYIGIARRDSAVRCRGFEFTGDRATVRDRSAKAALQMLRLALMNEDSAPLLWEMVKVSASSSLAGGRG